MYQPISQEVFLHTTVSFYSDLLAHHDSRIRSQLNPIIDEIDGIDQVANIYTMRRIPAHLPSRELRHGPLFFHLTDLRRGNIFVDENWNIKYIMDLEWARSLPVEMLAPPIWITNRGLDDLIDEKLFKYERECKVFMHILEEEEKSFPRLFDDNFKY
ncbi:uncharacterized protein RSE6_10720 [Rhynchosporium secalis]|uniref:Aminoglycoside phosphotransferase domain-containing protein n=1 Tax=Rhynchosporium secalis TaxID=38038 RepID=A0A1E1ML79_RHYSE|nr:uncharacterized protein RSE6_10720 [Rhynchosporium secalis]